MKYRYIILSLGFFCVMLSACSPVAVPPKQYYNLSATLPMQSQTSAQRVLLVTPTSAESPYKGNKIAYTEQEQPYQIHTFAENYWASAPAKLVTPNVTNAMISSGHFKAVANPPYGGSADYRLDTDLLTLVQQFNGNTSQVVFSLHAVLVNAQSNQILHSKNFTVTQTASANNPQAGVVAANQALTSVLQQLQTWVVNSTP